MLTAALCRIDQVVVPRGTRHLSQIKIATGPSKRTHMVPSTGKPGVFRFSTNDLPERDRLPIWREVFGRAITKADIEPLGDRPFLSESCVHLPDVTIRSSSASAAVVRRTAALVADGDDNFVLAIISGAN
jgi:hypothetical protein